MASLNKYPLHTLEGEWGRRGRRGGWRCWKQVGLGCPFSCLFSSLSPLAGDTFVLWDVSPGIAGSLDTGWGWGGLVLRRAEQELDAAQELRLLLGLRCCGFLPVGRSA